MQFSSIKAFGALIKMVDQVGPKKVRLEGPSANCSSSSSGSSEDDILSLWGRWELMERNIFGRWIKNPRPIRSGACKITFRRSQAKELSADRTERV